MARRKLASVKVWVAIWAMAMLSYIVVRDKAVSDAVYHTLGAIILGFMGFNVWQKDIYKKSGQEGGDRPLS